MQAFRIAIAAAGAALFTLGGAVADEAQIRRGEYLGTIMDCGGCHTPGALIGQPDTSRLLAGSEIGFGGPPPGPGVSGPVVYPPNLTPDPATGLGEWTAEQILTAVRQGMRPDGRQLAPVMPWPHYGYLTDEDGRALVAWLRSLPPVSNPVPGPVPPGEQAPSPYLTLVVPE